MCKKPSEYVLMRLYDKKINNKKECIIRTVGTFYSSVIKHVHIFSGMICHVQQNVVKCLIIPLSRFSYIYWLIHFKGKHPYPICHTKRQNHVFGSTPPTHPWKRKAWPNIFFVVKHRI